MRWTKLKQRVEERFVPAAKGRVELQITRYRRAHDQEGELWLTLDGVKVYGSAYYQYWKGRMAAIGLEGGEISLERTAEIERSLEDRGVTDQYDLQRVLFDSLSQSIEDMLSCRHPLIRAFAVLDKRCGQRRLSGVDLDHEHDLVRRMCLIRLPNRDAELDRVAVCISNDVESITSSTVPLRTQPSA